MLFDKNDDVRNERILYQAKPNMLFGCKKAIYGIVLLVIVFILSPKVIQFVGNMQVYLISYINLALTRYAAIGFFIVILFIILFIIWQLIGWYSKEYILTQSRIIIKYGVLSTKKNYMPYAAIQDINTSQSVFGKIFNVGTISLFSAYDNNQMELSAISNPSEVEEIIFSNMVNHRAYGESNSYPHNDMSYGRNFQTNDSYLEKNDYYDEFEPITPIGREKDRYSRRDYEYYPDDFSQGENNRKKYEYEPYNDNFYDVEDKQFEPRYKEPLNQYDDYGRDSVAYEPNSIRYEESYDDYGRDSVAYEPNSIRYEESYDDYGRDSAAYESNSIRYDEPSNQYSDKSYYNEVRGEYSYRDDEYYQNNGREVHYNDDANNNVQDKSVDVDDSSEKVIRRHFDKFKK
ncbi:PH domain-containing protein [uncultured Methanobrevibacter sp.]|uniref:PH domain-containing protein n=1 Tax=uncultured Methanobrevibacter sp. TaxID=253161 RepID=UPI00320B6E49